MYVVVHYYEEQNMRVKYVKKFLQIKYIKLLDPKRLTAI